MKAPIAYVDIRFSAHATEDPEKVKKAAYNLFPAQHIERVAFKRKALKGHYGNSIILFETRIKDRDLIMGFMENLSSRLGDSEKEFVPGDVDSLPGKSELCLRIDKQAAYRNMLKLQNADPIYIRIRFKRGRAKPVEKLG